MSTIWVLVADSARARLLQADGPRGDLTEVQSLVHPESRMKDSQLESDRPPESGAPATRCSAATMEIAPRGCSGEESPARSVRH